MTFHAKFKFGASWWIVVIDRTTGRNAPPPMYSIRELKNDTQLAYACGTLVELMSGRSLAILGKPGLPSIPVDVALVSAALRAAERAKWTRIYHNSGSTLQTAERQVRMAYEERQRAKRRAA